MDILQHISMELSDYAKLPTGMAAEYHTLSAKYGNHLEQLQQAMPHELWKQFLTLEAERNMLAAMDEEARFCHGFRIGAKLMLDIMTASID